MTGIDGVMDLSRLVAERSGGGEKVSRFPSLQGASSGRAQRGGPRSRSEGAFTCPPCGRSYKTEAGLAKHTDLHVRCSREGCEFSAVPGKMKEHALVHSGRVQAFLAMSEEDIAKWRAERRRNWPTKAKLARLAEQEAEGGPKPQEKQPAEKRRACRFYSSRRGCRQGSACRYLHVEGAPPERRPKKPKRAPQNGARLRLPRPPQSAPTLLGRMLGREVDVELDVLLQTFFHFLEQVERE